MREYGSILCLSFLLLLRCSQFLELLVLYAGGARRYTIIIWCDVHRIPSPIIYNTRPDLTYLLHKQIYPIQFGHL